MSAETTSRNPLSTMLGDLPNWATTLFVGSAVVLLLDMLRVMLPSLSFVYAVIGTSGAGDFTVYAVAVFVAAALAARVCGINSRIAAPAMATLTVLLRLGLVVSDGGDVQLLVSSIGVVSAVGLLGAIAGSDLPPRHASRGLALGFLVHVTIDTVLRTQDSVWYGGAIAWLVAITLAAATIVGLLAARPGDTRPDVRTSTPWLLVGPVIAINGIYASTPGAIRAAWGEGAAWSGALLVTAHALGYVLGRLVLGGFVREAMGPVTLGLAGLTAVFTLGTTPGTAAFASLLVAVLTTLAFVLAGESQDDVLASRGRRSGSVSAGIILFLIIGLGYYVGYQTDLGFTSGLFPASAAVLVGLVMLRQVPREDAQPPMSAEDMATVAFAPFVALFVVMASTAAVPAPRTSASLEDLRVMTYNVRMGFAMDGTFDVEELAAVIRSESPDIVVLNEVDRGWMLTGGHDVLDLLANNVRMDHVFAPAADAIWGNAILTNLPLRDVTVTPLPLLEPAVMERSALSAVVQLGGGEEIGIVATHLSANDNEASSRREQAERIEELVREFALAGLPVVVAGDLNAEVDSPELEPLSALVDVVTESAGRRILTWPSDNPSQHIDHVLVSIGVLGRDVSVPQSLASDHLGVVVTLDFGPTAAVPEEQAPTDGGQGSG